MWLAFLFPVRVYWDQNTPFGQLCTLKSHGCPGYWSNWLKQ